MKPSPPASLVRLGEADVVRLCGLAAAAAGLELVAHHAVSRGERDGDRLRAVVEDDGATREVWVEPGEAPRERASWHCDCPVATVGAGADSTPYALGCAHVAAVLAAWVRFPADFMTPRTPLAAASAPIPVAVEPEAPPAQPTEQLTQPRLLRPPGRARSATTLAAELEHLSAADLSALARRVLNADLHDAAARAALDTALRAPAVLDPLLARLDSGPRALLAQVLLLGGTLTAADLDGIAARTERPASALHAEMATLARHGLVFAASAAEAGHDTTRSWRQISGWRVPSDLRPLLPTTLPIPPAPTRPGSGGAFRERPLIADGRSVRVVSGNPRPLLLALALLPRAPGPLNPFAAASVTRPHEAAPLTHSPPVRAPFPLVPGDLAPGPLMALARGLGVAPGLAQLARRLLLWAREAGTDFALHDLARLPAEELPLALRAAFAVWRGAELPAELADLDLPGSPIRAGYDAAHAALRPASLAAEVADARDFTLRLLAAAGEGVWYRADDLLDLVWRTVPLFLRGRQSAYATPAWWLRAADDPRPLRPGVRAEWQAGEGSYLMALLVGPPHWLGALDLAYAPDGQLFAVRVTALGAFLLGLRATPGGDEKLHHRGNGGHGGQKGENVEASAGRGEEERNRRGRGGHGGESEGDGEAATSATAATVDGAGAPGARAERSVFANEWGVPVLLGREGTLAAHPLAAGAELLDAIEVWARPEAVAGGRLVYRLAADRASAALDAGTAPDALLARLEQLDARNGTRVAPAIRARLEAWRAAYGASRIEAGWTLLEARDAMVLAEALAAVPQVAARCRRIAPDVALVPDADAPALRAALARRGFQV